MKKTNSKQTGDLGFLDMLIVMLNLAAGRGNYLLYGILHTENTRVVIAVVLVLDLLYLFANIKSFHAKKLKYSPFLVIFVMLVYNWFNILLQGYGDPTLTLEYLLLWFFFFVILSIQVSFLFQTKAGVEKGIGNLSKGYILLSFTSIFGVILTLSALHLGIADSGQVISPDYMSTNEEKSSYFYTWTFLSVLYNDVGVRVPFFQDYGYLCGLFHEPHILALHTIPCLILLLGKEKKQIAKVLTVLLAVSIMLFSGSATNILVVAVCIFVYFIVRLRSSIVASVSGLVLTVGVVFLFIAQSDGIFVDFLMGRFDMDNSSTDYTFELLTYTFTPRTLLGTNFLSTSFMESSISTQDVGFVVFFLNLVFLFIYFRNTIKLIFSKKGNLPIAVGFASLYYILHSAKGGGLTMFLQTDPVLFVFLQLFILNYPRDTSETQKQNKEQFPYAIDISSF